MRKHTVLSQVLFVLFLVTLAGIAACDGTTTFDDTFPTTHGYREQVQPLDVHADTPAHIAETPMAATFGANTAIPRHPGLPRPNQAAVKKGVYNDSDFLAAFATNRIEGFAYTEISLTTPNTTNRLTGLLFCQDYPSSLIAWEQTAEGFVEALDGAGAPLATPAFVAVPGGYVPVLGDGNNGTLVQSYPYTPGNTILVEALGTEIFADRGEGVSGTTVSEGVAVRGIPFQVLFPGNDDGRLATRDAADVIDALPGPHYLQITTNSGVISGQAVWGTLNANGNGAPAGGFLPIILHEPDYTAAVKTGATINGVVCPNTITPDAGVTVYYVVGIYVAGEAA